MRAAKCDVLFRAIIRDRGACEYPACDDPGPYEVAHLMGRRYAATRCDESNALLLCGNHHRMIDGWRAEKERIAVSMLGEDGRAQLRARALGQLLVSAEVFWQLEEERLTRRCHELGIDVRGAA